MYEKLRKSMMVADCKRKYCNTEGAFALYETGDFAIFNFKTNLKLNTFSMRK